MFKKSKGGASDSQSGRSAAPADPDEFTSYETNLRYDQDEKDEPLGSAEETARYIADMVGALAAMAGEAKLDLLTYLLNMARVEAELQARQTETPDDADD